MQDPYWFLPRMKIRDNRGRLTNFQMRPPQLKLLELLLTHNQVAVLKARQLGFTTLVIAFLLHRALTCADEYNILTVAHEGAAADRANRMMRVFLENLPAALRPNLLVDNKGELQFAHNGSLLKQGMAGGRSQGRSYTFRAFHATEVGLWPRGSSAAAGGVAVDEDAWSSILSTIHEDQHTRIVVESTATGPSGVFYKIIQTARSSPNWGFMFVPWHEHDEYRRPVPPGFELDDEERLLVQMFDLDLQQLAWRRWKIEDYGALRFRREYPATPEDPFLAATGMWFDVERLNRLIGVADPARLSDNEGHFRYFTYESNRRYAIGVDPSGGVGKDQAVIKVFRDDFQEVAQYVSRVISPRLLAEEVAKVSGYWGRAPVLIERNNYGTAVIERCEELGVNLWVDDDGNYWWTNPVTKKKLLDWGRELIDHGMASIVDPQTMQEMCHVREQKNGNIEADEGYNDDRMMATMLALWCCRRFSTFSPQKSMEDSIRHGREMWRRRNR